jgi:hypothetical protein
MSKVLKANRIFQIAHDKTLLITRAELLRSRGYEVSSALGNDEAKGLLKEGQSYQVFMIGHAASKRAREEMVQWLKANFPGAKILALNPVDEPNLADADFNFILNGPEQWLAAVESV